MNERLTVKKLVCTGGQYRSSGGELLEADFEGVHAFVGSVDCAFQVGGIAGDAGQTATYTEHHLSIGLVCRIPHDHLPEGADLRSEHFGRKTTQYQEFIAAETARQLSVRECNAQMSSNPYQCRISGRVSKVIVHAFEAVYVNNDDGIFAAHRCRYHFEGAAIRQAGEFVYRCFAAS